MFNYDFQNNKQNLLNNNNQERINNYNTFSTNIHTKPLPPNLLIVQFRTAHLFNGPIGRVLPGRGRHTSGAPFRLAVCPRQGTLERVPHVPPDEGHQRRVVRD